MSTPPFGVVLIAIVALSCLLALTVPTCALALLRADLRACRRLVIRMLVLVLLIAAAGLVASPAGIS